MSSLCSLSTTPQLSLMCSEFSALSPIAITLSSVQFSRTLVSDSLPPHEPQHTRPPYPSPTPRVHPNPCPLSLMPSNHLILCRPLLLPSVFPSTRVFSNELALCIRWPKYSINREDKSGGRGIHAISGCLREFLSVVRW